MHKYYLLLLASLCITTHLSLSPMIISHCPPPDTHSRVILKSLDEEDFLTTYINANYLKVSGNVCIYKQNLAQCSSVM